MDRETAKRMKQAKDNLAKMELAKDPNNKEFWEGKKKSMEDMKQTLSGQIAEVDFLIGCYEAKLSELENTGKKAEN